MIGGDGQRRRAWISAGCLACATLACSGSRDPTEGFRSPVPEKRAAAVASLRGEEDDRNLPVLQVAQADPSAVVRIAAAGVFAGRRDPGSTDALGKLLDDPDPEVVAAAAQGLGGRAQDEKSRESARRWLVGAYWRAPPEGRVEIAAALRALGILEREAVEREARQLWDRNLAALTKGGEAARGAAEEIGRSGRTEAVERLRPLLEGSSTEPGLVAAAARGLGQAGDPQVRLALERILEKNDLSLREAAAEALGNLGDPAAARSLARAALSGPARVADVALDALGLLPNASEVGAAICQIVTGATGPDASLRAARLVRQREVECSEKPLLPKIKGSGTEAAAALATLAALGVRPEATKEPAERALAAFENGSADPRVRALAARALGELGWEPAIPVLEKRSQALIDKLGETPAQKGRAEPPPDPGTAERAAGQELHSAAEELGAVAIALARLRGTQAEPLLTRLLGRPEEALRASAAEGFGTLGGEVARSHVSPVLGDPGLRVRLAAAGALGRSGSAAAAILTRAARASRPSEVEWRSALARALAETGTPEAVPGLATLLEGESAPVAAAALGRLGAKEGAIPLLAHLGRARAPGRIEALEALGLIGAAESGPALLDSLASDRPDVRVAAARALERIRYAPAAPRLAALRSDYYGEVRRAANEAMGKLPAPEPGR